LPESSSMTVEQLDSSAGESFRQLYAIYAASIAAREQKGERWIAAMIGAPSYRVLVSKADGTVRGFSILFLPPGEGFALLEYMAVAPGARNHGLGAELFLRTAERAVTSEGRRLPVLLEIDSDREASSDRAIRTRREGFYRRLGCLRIAGLRYVMPLAGEGPAPEMDLFIHMPDAAGGIARADLRRWIETVYRDVYHCPPDDPRIARMLAGLPDPVPLE
jgi:GNAT superfamily N-acetyltransferase